MRKRSLLVLAALLLTGCVQRQLTIESNPPGALVFLNDQEIGRTPVTHDFIWYGKYDIILRKQGYQPVKTTMNVVAPWWQWVPFDLVAEAFPVTDRQHFSYSLRAESNQPANPQMMLDRGRALRAELQSGVNTRFPTTAPATTQSTTKPTTSR